MEMSVSEELLLQFWPSSPYPTANVMLEDRVAREWIEG